MLRVLCNDTGEHAEETGQRSEEESPLQESPLQDPQ